VIVGFRIRILAEAPVIFLFVVYSGPTVNTGIHLNQAQAASFQTLSNSFVSHPGISTLYSSDTKSPLDPTISLNSNDNHIIKNRLKGICRLQIIYIF
jgi:hypothetical protein